MRVARTISELDPAALARFEDCLFGAPFLSFVEEEHRSRAQPLYFHTQRDGGTVAFAVGYVYTGPPIPFTFRLEEFLPPGAARAVLRPDERYLVLNAPMRLRSRVLAGADADQAQLLDAIVEWARGEGLAAVVLPFVLASDATLTANLAAAGFAHAFYEGDFYLPLEGGDLEDFLRALAKGPRKQMRNDVNRLAGSGLEVTVGTDVARHADALADLHRALMDKYGRQPELDEESFRRFERLVPARQLTLAHEGGEIVAFTLSMFDRNVFQVLRYGRRADVGAEARVYGNLVFVESVRQALERGCRRVHFGKASQRAKTLRGCLHEEGIVYARCFDPAAQAALSAEFRELDVGNRERFDRLRHGAAAVR